MEKVTSDRKEVDFARLIIANIDNTWPLDAPFLPQAVREALWKKRGKRKTASRPEGPLASALVQRDGLVFRLDRCG